MIASATAPLFSGCQEFFLPERPRKGRGVSRRGARKEAWWKEALEWWSFLRQDSDKQVGLAAAGISAGKVHGSRRTLLKPGDVVVDLMIGGLTYPGGIAKIFFDRVESRSNPLSGTLS